MPSKTFLTNKTNSTKFRLNGVVPSSHLPDKSQLCQSFRDHRLYQTKQLPPKVDLRSDMTPVEDQSRIASCSANCLAGAYEYLTKKGNGRDTDISRLFIYYNARVKDQKSNQVVDAGCTMTSAIEALEELGTCLESTWPYNISNVNTRPNNQSYTEAKPHRITEALRVDINLCEMKSCLAQGFPFAFGLRLYASFDQAARTGVVPMPNMRESGRQAHGNHALLAIGYSDQSRAFIVRNSWGEQWGERGYCYIPYDYITNPSLCFDVWAVRQIATDDFGREHWDAFDRVNYIANNRNDIIGDHFHDNSQIIEDEDDDDDANDESDPWDQYRRYGGDDYSKKNDQYRDPFERYPNTDTFYYDQFRKEDNDYGYRSDNSNFNQWTDNGADNFDDQFAPPPANGYRSDYSDFNQWTHNGPSHFNSKFAAPPTFYEQPRYGSNYGYTSSFDNNNNFYNPFF